MEFGTKDRELILKMAKQSDELKKEVEQRLGKIEAVLKEKGIKLPSGAVSPVQMGMPDEPIVKFNNKHQPKGKKPRRRAPGKFSRKVPVTGDVEGESTIQVTFKQGAGDVTKQQILIEALYTSLKELCDANEIEKLFIRIDES